jgi:hypothetical protein
MTGNTSAASAPRYWIGVVSRDHVRRGEAGGFAQLCHGREAPLRRMQAGDWLVYYSPAEHMGGKEPLQAFTALGRVAEGEAWQERLTDDFTAYRKRIEYLPVTPAPIRPLLDTLSFIRDPQHWGSVFRFGHLEIPEVDFRRIAQAMGAGMP